jgi:hypothetical protein
VFIVALDHVDIRDDPPALRVEQNAYTRPSAANPVFVCLS